METEISASISALFVAVISIIALDIAIMFFAYLLGQMMSALFDE